MDKPVRQYQKQKDYQRHKLFRKMKRRRKAKAELESLQAIKMLKRKLKVPKFGEGKDPFYDYAERLAKKLSVDWNRPYEEVLTNLLNNGTWMDPDRGTPPEYDYRAFYEDNPQYAEDFLRAKPGTHFTDVGKTYWHPTFSNESKYSGKVSDENPTGAVGGLWLGDNYMLSEDQIKNNWNVQRTIDYIKRDTPNSFVLRPPKYEDGKVGYRRVETGNPVAFDDEGLIYDTGTGERGRITLPEVVVQPTMKTYRDVSDLESKADFIASNDAIQDPFGIRSSNEHLSLKTRRGERSAALWAQEHPNLYDASLIASTIPLAVASWPAIYPAATAVSDYVASSALAKGFGALMGTDVAGVPLSTWANEALLAGFAGNRLYKIATKGVDGYGDAVMGALELSPLTRLANPLRNMSKNIVSEAVSGARNIVESKYFGPLGEPKVPDNYITLEPKVITDLGDSGVKKVGSSEPATISLRDGAKKQYRLGLPLLPPRDYSINTVNKILKQYGYDPIDTSLSAEEIESQFIDRMQRHRQFLRGVYLPDATNGRHLDVRNLKNLQELAMEQFGDISDESLLKTAATTISKEDTGHGRQGLYYALKNISLPTDKSYDALYTSNRSLVAEGYSKSNWSRDSKGGAYKIQVPINDNPGASYIDRWMDNEFPITDENGRMSVWRTYVLPYLAKTGKLPQEALSVRDRFLENVLRNKAVNSTRSPESMYNHAVSFVNGILPKRLIKDVNEANKYLEEFGLNKVFPQYNVAQGTFTNANAISRIRTDLYYLKLAKDNYNNSLSEYERFLALPFEDRQALKTDLSLGLPFAPEEQVPAEIINMHNYLRSLLDAISNLYLSGNITKKLSAMLRKAVLVGDITTLKDFNFSSAAKRIVSNAYLRSREEVNAVLRRNYARLKNNSTEDNLNSGAEKYISPFEGFGDLTLDQLDNSLGIKSYANFSNKSRDGLLVFTTEGVQNPNPNDTGGTHFVFIAPRDTKIANVVEKVHLKTNRNDHGHGGTIFPGISRNLGSWLIPAGFGLGPAIKSEAFEEPLAYSGGKDIYIKQSKRGTFTTAAKRRGMSVQEFASKVLSAPKGKYSAAMRKKANFAKNAKKFKH